MKRTKKNPRGAGRPKLGKVRLVVTVSLEFRNKVCAAAKARSTTLGDALQMLHQQ